MDQIRRVVVFRAEWHGDAQRAKQVVDGLPPLTDKQREVLALIFRSNRSGRATSG
jgi:hypothetical protein